MKAYGKFNPIPADNPTFYRKTTLEYAKKAVSYFMEISAGWIEEPGGYPTKARRESTG